MLDFLVSKTWERKPKKVGARPRGGTGRRAMEGRGSRHLGEPARSPPFPAEGLMGAASLGRRAVSASADPCDVTVSPWGGFSKWKRSSGGGSAPPSPPSPHPPTGTCRAICRVRGSQHSCLTITPSSPFSLPLPSSFPPLTALPSPLLL